MRIEDKGNSMNLIKTTDTGLLKFNTLDAVAGNILANMLEIEHSKMMRTIKRVMKSEHNRKKDSDTSGVIFSAKFLDWTYLDSMNRERKTYILNEDALYLVVANSQSAKAHELKVWFKSEFNKMKEERIVRERVKPIHSMYTDMVQYLYKGLKEDGSKLRDEAMLHTNFSVKIRKAVTGKKMKRDELSAEQMQNVVFLESKVAMCISNSIEEKRTAREARTIAYDMIKNWDMKPVHI